MDVYGHVHMLEMEMYKSNLYFPRKWGKNTREKKLTHLGSAYT